MESNVGTSLFQPGALQIENVQNNEEEEELEEQRRRQEEIQNFLTTAMDDFNYDDQSTANSSTNLSTDENLINKYKSSSLDDQLKVLYEVRVREVKELTEQLERLKQENDKQLKMSSKKCLLLEAEKDQAQISLKQSQDLLVEKNDEIKRLLSETDCLKRTVSNLEKQVMTINDDYVVVKQSNKELSDRLCLMHNGLTSNTISDKEMYERHQAEISQLHHLLDISNTKLFKKERECKEFMEKFKELINDKEQLMIEKSTVINRLTENLENAQQQCQDLLQIIEKLSQENKNLKLSNASSDTSNVLNLTEKIEYINALQKELGKSHEKYNGLQTQFDDLQKAYEVLSENYRQHGAEKERLQDEIEKWKQNCNVCELNSKKTDEEMSNVKLLIDDYKAKLINQREEYEQKIATLEGIIRNYKSASKTGGISMVFRESSTDELDKLKLELSSAQSEIQELNTKLSSANEQLSKFQLTADLEKERETLIKNLRDKAAQFEKIIKERQTMESKKVSTGVNTDESSTNEELLKTQYDSNLIQKEIDLRATLQEEFDQRLQEAEREMARRLTNRSDNGGGGKCTKCEELSIKLQNLETLTYDKDERLQNLQLQMREDRNTLADLLESWRDQIMEIHEEKRHLLQENYELKEFCNQLEMKMRSKEAGNSKLLEVIRKECDDTIRSWNKEVAKALKNAATIQIQTVNGCNRKIGDISENADAEVQTIERLFLKRLEDAKRAQLTS